MKLNIKKGNEICTTPLLSEKLGGVELPYLHVKKGDKTWYAPLFKKTKYMKDEDVLPIVYTYKGQQYRAISNVDKIYNIKDDSYEEWGYVGYDINSNMYGKTIIFINSYEKSYSGDLKITYYSSGWGYLMTIGRGDIIKMELKRGYINVINFTTGKIVNRQKSYGNVRFIP